MLMARKMSPNGRKKKMKFSLLLTQSGRMLFVARFLIFTLWELVFIHMKTLSVCGNCPLQVRSQQKDNTPDLPGMDLSKSLQLAWLGQRCCSMLWWLMVGFNDLGGVFQPQCFYNGMAVCCL